MGFLLYREDYNDRFPSAGSATAKGWKDAIFPYIKTEETFQCFATLSSSAPSTDYFYNRGAGGFALGEVPSPTQTILSGDGADDAPPWNSIMQLPPAWSAKAIAPSRRHFNAANYLFIDGHVKSFKATDIMTASPSSTNKPTFAVK